MKRTGARAMAGLLARYGREASHGRLQRSLALQTGLASLINAFEAFVEHQYAAGADALTGGIGWPGRYPTIAVG